MEQPRESMVDSAPSPAAAHGLAGLLAPLRAAFGGPPAPETLDRDKSANELAEERTTLAIDRTLMAADRSLMAWIRTALSMISFGFTIYKLLQSLAASGTQLASASSPRTMGLFLTGLGTLAMVFGTIEYWFRLEELRRRRRFSVMRPSLVIALLMSLIGLFLFVAIIFRAL